MAAAAQDSAARRPSVQIAGRSDDAAPSPRARAWLAWVIVSFRAKPSRQEVDRDALGELLRVGGRVEHLDELQILGGDADLVDKRLADGMVVVDELAQNLGQLGFREAGRLERLEVPLRHLVGMMG